jgi:hypothetical protein
MTTSAQVAAPMDEPFARPIAEAEGEQLVTLRLTPKAARNLELMLNRTSAGPAFAALQFTCAFTAVVLALLGGGVLWRAAIQALEGYGAPALVLFLWGSLALFSGCAGSVQQLAIVTALKDHKRK